MPKLTKRVIDGAENRAAPYFIWCSDLPGFGVRVFPSGKRTYYADYYNRAGVRKRMSIGPHGKLTTDEARKLALTILSDVLKGDDPAEERATRRKSLTVAELCKDYVDAADQGLIMGKGGRPKKASTIYVDRGRIEHHIKPLLGSKFVRDLTKADVSRFIRDVAAGKTATVRKSEHLRGKAVVEGGLGAAARTAGLLGGILSFAVSQGVIDINPVQGVQRPADKRRSRRLTDDEYRALGDALSAAEADREIDQAVQGIWLLALTGCRLGEIEGLKWSEVDRDGGCFRLAETKEGESIRPVGQSVFQLLAKVERMPGCPYVLPAAFGARNYGGMPGAMKRIMQRAKLEGVTAHTLRHSFASVAGDLGFTESTIAAMLGHAAGSVTSRYVHHLDSVLVAAADRVARTIRAQMAGSENEVIYLTSKAGKK